MSCKKIAIDVHWLQHAEVLLSLQRCNSSHSEIRARRSWRWDIERSLVWESDGQAFIFTTYSTRRTMEGRKEHETCKARKVRSVHAISHNMALRDHAKEITEVRFEQAAGFRRLLIGHVTCRMSIIIASRKSLIDMPLCILRSPYAVTCIPTRPVIYHGEIASSTQNPSEPVFAHGHHIMPLDLEVYSAAPVARALSCVSNEHFPNH